MLGFLFQPPWPPAPLSSLVPSSSSSFLFSLARRVIELYDATFDSQFARWKPTCFSLHEELGNVWTRRGAVGGEKVARKSTPAISWCCKKTRIPSIVWLINLMNRNSETINHAGTSQRYSAAMLMFYIPPPGDGSGWENQKRQRDLIYSPLLCFRSRSWTRSIANLSTGWTFNFFSRFHWKLFLESRESEFDLKCRKSG